MREITLKYNSVIEMRLPSRVIHVLIAILVTTVSVQSQELVILHTNDTHSQIEPTDKGLGGIMRRKALIDSVRSLRGENVLLIDAGDMLHATL